MRFGANDSGAPYVATLVAKIGSDKLAELAVSRSCCFCYGQGVESGIPTQEQLEAIGIPWSNANRFTGNKKVTIDGYDYNIKATTKCYGIGVTVANAKYKAALFLGKKDSYIEFRLSKAISWCR